MTFQTRPSHHCRAAPRRLLHRRLLHVNCVPPMCTSRVIHRPTHPRRTTPLPCSPKSVSVRVLECLSRLCHGVEEGPACGAECMQRSLACLGEGGQTSRTQNAGVLAGTGEGDACPGCELGGGTSGAIRYDTEHRGPGPSEQRAQGGWNISQGIRRTSAPATVRLRRVHRVRRGPLPGRWSFSFARVTNRLSAAAS